MDVDVIETTVVAGPDAVTEVGVEATDDVATALGPMTVVVDAVLSVDCDPLLSHAAAPAIAITVNIAAKARWLTTDGVA